MSYNILKSVLENVYKASTRDFDSTFQELNLNTKQATTSKFSRDILQGSIHSISKNNISLFLKEFAPTEDVSEATNIYFEALKAGRKDILDLGTEFLVLLKPPTGASINSFRKLLNRQSLTYNDKKLIQELVPANGYKLVSDLATKVNKALLKKPKTPDILLQFINSGIDIGHVGLSSNINFLLGTVVTTGIAGGVTKVSTSKEELSSLYDSLSSEKDKADLLAIFSDNMADSRSSLSTEITERLFNYIFDSQIELIRLLSKTGVSGKAKISLNKNAEKKILGQLKAIVGTHISHVAPQNSAINQALGRIIEAQVRRRIPLFYDAALKLVNRKILESKEFGKETYDLEGSPSTKKLILDHVVNSILGKSNPTKEIKSIASISPVFNKKSKLPIISKTSTVTSKVNKTITLRTVNGRYTSVLALSNMIQELLNETVADNMVRPNLIHRTGRFSDSVKVKDIKQRDKDIQVFLTYMKYPYQTFEPGFKQGHKGYDPRRLIDQSVREIATKLVKARLQTVVV